MDLCHYYNVEGGTQGTLIWLSDGEEAYDLPDICENHVSPKIAPLPAWQVDEILL